MEEDLYALDERNQPSPSCGMIALIGLIFVIWGVFQGVVHLKQLVELVESGRWTEQR